MRSKAARRILRWIVHPAVPLSVFTLLATVSMFRKSATFDEAVLLSSGVRVVKAGDLSFNSENPPLLKAFYALPAVFFRDIELPELPESSRSSYRMEDGFRYGNRFLYSQSHPFLLLFCCRFMVVLLGCALGWLIYAAGRAMWGSVTAGILLWIYCLSPNIYAHARLFTPDLGCAFFIFLTVLMTYRLLRHGRSRDSVYCGLALGGALLAKFTCVLLIPVMILQFVFFAWLSGRWRDVRSRLLHFAAAGLLALFVVNLCYGFRGTGHALSDSEYYSPLVTGIQGIPVLRGIPLPIPAQYLRGFDIVANNNRPGFPNIFLGRLYPSGGSWWYYYCVVLALKLPVALLAGIFAGLVTIVRDQDRDWESLAVFAVPPVVFFFNFSFVAYRQLGLRYILPMWPFFFMCAGFAVDKARTLWSGSSAVCRSCCVLGSWYVLSSLWVAPDYLTYFNEFAGGSRNGWRYLASSNYDWGQDLPALARWQRDHPGNDMYVLYHGMAPLDAYGIEARKWGELPLPPYMAVSVTNYFLEEHIPLVSFLRDHREPVARPGGSIHIYELEPGLLEEMIQRDSERIPSEG